MRIFEARWKPARKLIGHTTDMPNVTQILQTLSEATGVYGCVLSDVASGMSIHVCGVMPELERIGEAAIEFWRVQERLGSYFETLGHVHTISYLFKDHLIALFPCKREPGIVLICVADKRTLDWSACQTAVRAVQAELANRPL